MDIHQLKTFVTVARERSITQASELLHLSQSAVSAHIKAIEDALGLTLFDRTPRRMSLTGDGERLLAKAEQTLAVHHDLMDEATRIKDISRERSASAQGPTRATRLDAGFYNEGGEPAPELATIEASTFTTYLVAQPGLVATAEPLNWGALAELPWIYPTASACCARTVESLFKANHVRPRRIISVDREDVTRTLVMGGIGVGLLHADTATAAHARGELDLVYESPGLVRVLFAHLASRAQDPLLAAATSIMRAAPASNAAP